MTERICLRIVAAHRARGHAGHPAPRACSRVRRWTAKAPAARDREGHESRGAADRPTGLGQVDVVEVRDGYAGSAASVWLRGGTASTTRRASCRT